MFLPLSLSWADISLITVLGPNSSRRKRYSVGWFGWWSVATFRCYHNYDGQFLSWLLEDSVEANRTWDIAAFPTREINTIFKIKARSNHWFCLLLWTLTLPKQLFWNTLEYIKTWSLNTAHISNRIISTTFNRRAFPHELVVLKW